MKCLKLTLVGRLSRIQRRAGVLMLLLALAPGAGPGGGPTHSGCRPLWAQSVPAAPASAASPESDTLHSVLAPVLAAQSAIPGLGAPAPVGSETSGEAFSAPASAETAHRYLSTAHLLSGLQLFGQKSYPFRWVQVSGSPNARRAFESQSSRTGSLTEMTVMGRLLDMLEVNMTLSGTAYGTDSRRMMARFQQGGLDLRVGDVPAGFDGNTLVPFRRLVRGAVAEQRFGADTRVTAMVSTSKAPTKQVAVPGNNTAGPYYLNAFPIDLDSVRVRIDDTDVPRDAYTVDAYAGTITFLGGRIVPQTSLLRVHFATRAQGISGGTLYGARLTHRFSGGHSLGVTAMSQETSPSERSGDLESGRERLDDWSTGHADSAGPYQLRYGPVVRGTERVFVGGVLQQAGIDYVIDHDRGVIQFGRLILGSEPIRVIYRQRVTEAIEPAGQIVGVDGTIRLGKSAQVTAQLARSIGAPGSTGNAVTIEGKVGLLEDALSRQPRLRLGAAVRSIDPRFSPLDGGSFLRNDRGLSLDGEFAVNPYVRLYSRWQQSRRAEGPLPPGGGSSTGFAGEILNVTERVSGAAIRYPGWPTLTIQSSRLDQDGKRGDSRQATDSVRLELDRRRFRAAAEWGRGETEGQPFAALGAASAAPASTQTAKLSLGYTPTDRLTLAANGVVSDIRSATGGREYETTARSVDLNATFSASRAVQLTASYVLADAGTPAGSADGGSSPGGGLPSLRLLPGTGSPLGLAYGGNQRISRLGVTYAPGPRFNLSASLDATDTELYGEATGHSLGVSYAPFSVLTLSGNLSRQASRLAAGGTAFGGSSLNSDLTYLSLRAGPFGRLTMDLDYQHLAARGGTALAGGPGGSLVNETRSYSGRLSHPVGGHTAFLQYQHTDYGGSLSTARKGSATAGIDFRLGRVLGLKLDLELHRYHDAHRPSDSYRARIISGNLSARF